MAVVVRFPLSALRRIRRLNGIIPLSAHVAAWVNAINAHAGRIVKPTILVPMDDVVTASLRNLAEVEIPLPIWNDETGNARVRVDVLGYAVAAGRHVVSFVATNGDAVGVAVSFDNFEVGATSTPAIAEWQTTGEEDGDQANQEARALQVADGGNNLETVVYTGNASVDVYAIQLSYIEDYRL